jgi:hypothetical protein
MGLFKRIFSGKKSGDSFSSEEGPRCDHYSFTHIVLRKAAFENPTHAVTTLASTEGNALLNTLWEDVRLICREHREDVSIDPGDILIHKSRVGTYPSALFEMPTPANPTEAFLVAMVLTIDLSNADKGFETTPLRYFTLELAESDSDELKTVIGEWFADDTHHIHGPGPEPMLDRFIDAITRIATQRRVE